METVLTFHHREKCKNSLPNDKFLVWSKLKALNFADDITIVTKIMKTAFGRTVNIVGKGTNSVYEHFLLFSQCCQKATFSGSLKVGILW